MDRQLARALEDAFERARLRAGNPAALSLFGDEPKNLWADLSEIDEEYRRITNFLGQKATGLVLLEDTDERRVYAVRAESGWRLVVQPRGTPEFIVDPRDPEVIRRTRSEHYGKGPWAGLWGYLDLCVQWNEQERRGNPAQALEILAKAGALEKAITAAPKAAKSLRELQHHLSPLTFAADRLEEAARLRQAALARNPNVEVQSLGFSLEHWTPREAEDWLWKHGYKTDYWERHGVHIWYRQADPEQFKAFRRKYWDSKGRPILVNFGIRVPKQKNPLELMIVNPNEKNPIVEIPLFASLTNPEGDVAEVMVTRGYSLVDPKQEIHIRASSGMKIRGRDWSAGGEYVDFSDTNEDRKAARAWFYSRVEKWKEKGFTLKELNDAWGTTEEPKKPEYQDIPEEPKKPEYRDIPIDAIEVRPDLYQWRNFKYNEDVVRGIVESFDPAKFEPIIVRPEGNKYHLLQGHHRLEAARRLGWETVPARVLDISLEKGRQLAAEIQMATKPLTPIEQAGYIVYLVDTLGKTFNEAGAAVNMRPEEVQTLYYLGKLPRIVRGMVEDNELPLALAKVLAWEAAGADWPEKVIIDLAEYGRRNRAILNADRFRTAIRTLAPHAVQAVQLGGMFGGTYPVGVEAVMNTMLARTKDLEAVKKSYKTILREAEKLEKAGRPVPEGILASKGELENQIKALEDEIKGLARRLALTEELPGKKEALTGTEPLVPGAGDISIPPSFESVAEAPSYPPVDTGRLKALVQTLHEPASYLDIARTLGYDPEETRLVLDYWTEQGLIRRLPTGTYMTAEPAPPPPPPPKPVDTAKLATPKPKPTEQDVLRVLSREWKTAKQIAKALKTSAISVMSVLDKLAARGAVEISGAMPVHYRLASARPEKPAKPARKIPTPASPARKRPPARLQDPRELLLELARTPGPKRARTILRQLAGMLT